MIRIFIEVQLFIIKLLVANFVDCYFGFVQFKKSYLLVLRGDNYG